MAQDVRVIKEGFDRFMSLINAALRYRENSFCIYIGGTMRAIQQRVVYVL